MLQLLGVHVGLRQLVPNGAVYRRRDHVLAYFLPEKFYLGEESRGREIENKVRAHTGKRMENATRGLSLDAG